MPKITRIGKKTFLVLLAVIIVLGINAGVLLINNASREEEEPPPPPEAVVSPIEVVYTPVSIDHGELIVFKGRSEQLALPADGLTWTSDNEAAATVDSAGIVTGVEVGDAVITVTSDRGDKAAWAVKVRKTAYLTFDDFPNDSTKAILDTLREKHAVSTFFLCKAWQDEYMYLYQKIIDEGHLIGNHTASHDFNKIYANEDKFMKDFDEMESFLREHNISTRFARFPGGSVDRLHPVRTGILNKLLADGYTVVDWTVETRDTATTDPKAVFGTLKKRCTETVSYHSNHDVEIILMHNLKVTAKALPDIIDWLREQGYEFARLDDAPQTYLADRGWEDNLNRRDDPRVLTGPFDDGEKA